MYNKVCSVMELHPSACCPSGWDPGAAILKAVPVCTLWGLSAVQPPLEFSGHSPYLQAYSLSADCWVSSFFPFVWIAAWLRYGWALPGKHKRYFVHPGLVTAFPTCAITCQASPYALPASLLSHIKDTGRVLPKYKASSSVFLCKVPGAKFSPQTPCEAPL